jgi:hypothetical protein
MGSYSELYVDTYPLFSEKSGVDLELMTVFREKDKRIYEQTILERRMALGINEEGDEDEVITICEYKNSVENIKQRLEVMGFTLDRARREYEQLKIEEIDQLKRIRADKQNDFALHIKSQEELLDAAIFDDWLSAFKIISGKRLSRYTKAEEISTDEQPLLGYIFRGTSYEVVFRFPCADIRTFLRAFLEICPNDAPVIYEISDLVTAGYYGLEDKVCEIALHELTADYPVNEKIIVLTEGSTDRNILEKSLALLYPHLYDYYSFMDFGISNAPGSAGALVSTIKAFVGSGIANRIVAFFDNDTAAQVALKGLSKTSIPQNIRVLRYPVITYAKSYPTLGPSGISELDINGLACSIELYLGIDVLTIDGQLVPIQWKGYDVSLNRYQGEIIRKQELQDRFTSKLKDCLDDQSLIAQKDWSAIRLILTELFRAFN